MATGAGMRGGGGLAGRWLRAAPRRAGGGAAPAGAPPGCATLAEAAAVLGVRARDVGIAIDAGYLAACGGTGRRRYVAVAELVDYMDRRPWRRAFFRPELLPPAAAG